MGRVTLSVPDELMNRIEAVKDRVNMSRVFQAAITARVEQLEHLKKQATEDTNMLEIIERLKTEKVQAEDQSYERGREAGLRLAKTLPYSDLRYAAEEYELTDNFSCAIEDSVFGDYIKDEIQDEPDYVINFTRWEKGFLDAIQAFWAEVKEKI